MTLKTEEARYNEAFRKFEGLVDAVKAAGTPFHAKAALGNAALETGKLSITHPEAGLKEQAVSIVLRGATVASRQFGGIGEDEVMRIIRVNWACGMKLADGGEKKAAAPKQKRTRSSQGENHETPPADGRPVIRIDAGELHHAVDRGEDILIKAGPGPIFQRGRALVHITKTPVVRSDGKRELQEAIGIITPAYYLRQVAKNAVCQRYDARSRDYRTVDPPKDMSEQYFALPSWKLPPLRQLIFGPTLRPDGTVLNQPGYDQVTGLFLTDPVRGLKVPDSPTQEDAERAYEEISDIFKGFKFADPDDAPGQSLSVALVGLMAAVLRPVLSAAPLIGVTAPIASSGKSYLVDSIALIAQGKRVACVPISDDQKEFDKALAAALMEGRPLLSLDNVDEHLTLKGGLLARLFTEENVDVRVLGLSRIVRVNTSVGMFATGNNLKIGGDQPRRTLMCALDTGSEKPEHIVYDVDLFAEIERRRAHLLSCVLTIARWWRLGINVSPESRARVNAAEALASFGQWCAWCRDPLVGLGACDPVKSVQCIRAADDREAVNGLLLELWMDVFQHEQVSCRQVVDKAVAAWKAWDQEAVKEPEPCSLVRLGELLRDVARDRDGSVSPNLLGHRLRGIAKRPFGGRKVIRGEKHRTHGVSWSVVLNAK